MTMTNDETYYSSDELLEIFKEQHRLCSPLDYMADETFILNRETKIYEWSDAQDLRPWEEIGTFLNQEFRIDVSRSEWERIFNPDDRQTLGNLCHFLSTVAKKEIVKPVRILGAECLSAAIFLTLKRKLKSKGVNVTDLRPSTPVEPFLGKNFSPLIEEITLTGVKVFDKIEYGDLKRVRRLAYWIDKLLPNWIYKRPIKTGNIKVFRDLVERIIENKKLGSPRVKI